MPFKTAQAFEPTTTKKISLSPDMIVCQQDYPLDFYQTEFMPYAEEYLALPDRRASTILNWMTPYVTRAQKHFGESLLLLAHYYMGGEIVKLVEHFGGTIGDSYQLAIETINHPEKKIIVESAVHFMAESITLLANADQHVYITNPKSGCTMEMFAKDDMVEPILTFLNERYGRDTILPICYMNTSGRIKALCGAQNGAVCTSANVKKIFAWAREHHKKIFFIPDKNMGENVAHWLDIKAFVHAPSGEEAAQFSGKNLSVTDLQKWDEAELVLFGSFCSVHDYFTTEMIDYWRARGYTVLVHPECTWPVVDKADGAGSTAYLWDQVSQDKFHTQKYAVGTENHMVQNLKEQMKAKNIEVVNLGDAKISNFKGMGCGCATMSRNDPPHLVALLDLLQKGKVPEYNEVRPGDVVNEWTGRRERLSAKDQAWVAENACRALKKMIEVVSMERSS